MCKCHHKVSKLLQAILRGTNIWVQMQVLSQTKLGDQKPRAFQFRPYRTVVQRLPNRIQILTAADTPRQPIRAQNRFTPRQVLAGRMILI
ncbi:hypothetical protein AUP71_08895 [Corynebacterium glutamicum]|nr:hypothetical protein A3654_03970 [Corynebacterium glutamicum]OKX93729.1 hypothetical protein AUP71_08895 [Corynebacterium glutamicum]